ncbi:unnamed protein product [Tuber melanosporum]|uniref:(Perigord truffle) hypothetical protein n=1 Tax=Tuber melanosporum (strain Mel28) TaxID=656061 RepID=D5GCR5_TUBMM|nr:uncharacterized protein GSTUM_00005988001 [Tuber melanosporum]CAZ82308.1 unnamed protein product [Tuber melanosporum]
MWDLKLSFYDTRRVYCSDMPGREVKLSVPPGGDTGSTSNKPNGRRKRGRQYPSMCPGNTNTLPSIHRTVQEGPLGSVCSPHARGK